MSLYMNKTVFSKTKTSKIQQILRENGKTLFKRFNNK